MPDTARHRKTHVRRKGGWVCPTGKRPGAGRPGDYETLRMAFRRLPRQRCTRCGYRCVKWHVPHHDWVKHEGRWMHVRWVCFCHSCRAVTLALDNGLGDLGEAIYVHRDGDVPPSLR